MVSVVKRRKGKRHYYYLYHDSKRGGKRVQNESYIGTEIPPDIEERKNNFALKIEREYWVPQLERICLNAKKELKRMPESVQEKNMNAFAIKFTYNTQRIEGSTLTFMDTALLLGDGITPSNRPNLDVKETEAHQKLFMEVMEQKPDLSLSTVLKWHKKMFEETKPDMAGLLRSYDVRIYKSKSVPPPHHSVSLLLKGFFKWYNASKKTLNPAELAALVHLKFVTIHPFGDGNGRTSRLMMNCVLNRFDYPPLDIEYGDRHSYYTALERSQTKNNDLFFLRWFMKRYVKAHERHL